MEPSVRAGDADRRHVVEQLQRHYVDGRLTSEELSDRMERAMAACTFGDLETLLRDLPRHEANEEKSAGRAQWWTPFVRMPGVLLLAMVAILVLAWVAWLPNAGVVAAPVLLLGGVFVFVKR